MLLIKKLGLKAKKNPKFIVFPESTEERTLKAVSIIAEKGIAKPILVGNESEIRAKIKKLKVKINEKKIRIIDNIKSEQFNKYAEQLCKLRNEKGLSLEQTKELLKEPIYFAAMLVKLGEADGLISGAVHSTNHTLRPAFQVIRTRPGILRASGFMLMEKGNKTFIFADCAVNPAPNAEELAGIALSSAESAVMLGITPKVALLSFSTTGSAEHALVDKVRTAADIAKQKAPKLILDGELQLDSAVIPEIAKLKCPKSPVKGNANVLIFPDLNSGNIGYKLIQRLAGYSATGPIIQGLNKPVNDLSRGCSVKDIVNAAIITVLQAQVSK